MRTTTPGAAENIGLCVSCTTIDYGSRGNHDGWNAAEYIFHTPNPFLLLLARIDVDFKVSIERELLVEKVSV